MKKLIAVMLLANLFCYSCGTGNKSTGNNNINASDSLRITDSMVEAAIDTFTAGYRGAEISDSLQHVEVHLFSSETVGDTFVIRVPAGLVARTTSHIFIKTVSNRVIYSTEFATAAIPWTLQYPEAILVDTNELRRNIGLLNHLNSITRSQVEYCIKERVAKTNFRDFIKSKQELADAMTYCDIPDSEWVKEIIKPEAHNVILFVPNVLMNGGGEYVVYSAKDSAAKTILELDGECME